MTDLLFFIQVSAEDKASGKSQKITITSEKGRLSEAEIERMVREAEDFAEQDKKDKASIVVQEYKLTRGGVVEDEVELMDDFIRGVAVVLYAGAY